MVLTPRQEKLQALRDEMAPGGRPAAIVPRNFAEAQQMCGALARSGLVPRDYIDKPENMIVTVMAGAEIGLPPMASLRLYHIMDSIPRLSAEGIRAVLLSHPEIEYFEPQTGDDKQATWIGKRRGRPEKSATWTVERAKRAGLWDRKNRDGSPGNWQKYTEDMLNARASMQLGRMIAPDIVAGMVSREEAMDGDFIQADATERKEQPAFVAPPVASGGGGGRVVILNSSTGKAVTPDDVRKMYPAPDGEHIARGMETIAKDAKPQVVAMPAGTWTAASPGPNVTAATAQTPPVEPPKKGAAAKAPKIAEPTAAAKAALAAEIEVVKKLQDAAFQAAAAGPPENSAPPESGSTDRWGQNVDPTRAASPSAPSPSAESAQISTSAPPSGVESTEPPVDEVFGDDAEDALPNEDLVDFHAWVNSCKNHRDLAAGLKQWQTWSRAKRAAGDDDFEAVGPGKKGGKKTIEMQNAYAKRKSEVPA
jgi:hypothetical protein